MSDKDVTSQKSLSYKRVASDEESENTKRPRVSLATWLTSSSADADLAALPMPTTTDAAYIQDRHSVFIGYVYPLTTASPTYISALIDHLKHVVHPTIPISQLPPQFQHSGPSKRGSTHDIYAYRVLQLKPGRTGLGGPSDFGIEQGKEDDGEAWGSDKVARVLREQGASDVLVIVSRWYGGELLGPVRFEHITNCARAALATHLDMEAVAEARRTLQKLDQQIAACRETPAKVNPYEQLTLERANRLRQAKEKTLLYLRKNKNMIS
ncbi:GCN2-mediated signaling protein [Malassezia pachydermatis]